MRVRRSILSFATVLLFSAVSAVTSLLVARPLLRWLGEPRFGAARLLMDWYGYLMLLELGLGGALPPLLARAAGRGDERALRGALAAGFRAYLGVGLLALAVGAAATPLVSRMLGDPLGPEAAGRLAPLVLAPAAAPPVGVALPPAPAAVAGPALAAAEGWAEVRWGWWGVLLGGLLIPFAPLRALAEAHQQLYRVNLFLTAQCLVVAAASVLLARAGGGVAGQGLAITLGVGTYTALLLADALRRWPHLAGSLRERADAATWRAVWALSLPSLLITLAGRLSLLTDNIIVGGLLGPARVTALVFTQRLAALAAAQLNAVGSSSWAALAEIHARDDHAMFVRRLLELTGLVLVLGVAALGPIAAYNHHFLALWVPENFDRVFGGDAVVVLTALNALALATFSLWGWCFQGTGRIRMLLAPSLASTALNLAGSLALTRRLGIVGPLLGTSLSFLLVWSWWYPRRLRAEFGVPPRALAAAVLTPLAWGVPYCGLLWWAARAHRPPWGWLGLAVEMAAAAVAFLALCVVAVLGPAERALWRARLAGLWPRRPAEAPVGGRD